MMIKRVLNITLAAICVLLLNSCSMQHDVSESPSESTQQNGSVQSTEESGNKTDSDNDMAQNEYCFICLDESNDPVSGVKLQVCSDDRCTMLESDSNGVVTFDGVPEEYPTAFRKWERIILQ